YTLANSVPAANTVRIRLPCLIVFSLDRIHSLWAFEPLRVYTHLRPFDPTKNVFLQVWRRALGTRLESIRIALDQSLTFCLSMIFFQNPDQAPSAIAHVARIQRAIEASEMLERTSETRHRGTSANAACFLSDRRAAEPGDVSFGFPVRLG